jgi:MOSC domain-containing protein YiiM
MVLKLPDDAAEADRSIGMIGTVSGYGQSGERRSRQFTTKGNHVAGRIASVGIRGAEGRKLPLPWITLRRNHGVVGELPGVAGRHQVRLLASECIDTMGSAGCRVSAQDYDVNIVTRGINLLDLPVGTRLQVGTATLILMEGGTGAPYGDGGMPPEVIVARVLHDGEIKPRNRIAVVVEKKPVVRRKTRRRTVGSKKKPKQKSVVSLRITDEEMLRLQELMHLTNKGASDLMREALALFTARIGSSRTAAGSCRLSAGHS